MRRLAVAVVALIVTLLPGVTEAQPNPPWRQGAPITEENVKYALGHSPKKLLCSLALSKPVSIGVDDAAGLVDLTYKTSEDDICTATTAEVDQLDIGAATTYAAHRSLFRNPRVQLVSITVLGTWIDQFGKESEEPSTRSVLGRATVDSRIGWRGLANRVESDNKVMFCSSDEQYVHPAILAKLKDLGCLALL